MAQPDPVPSAALSTPGRHSRLCVADSPRSEEEGLPFVSGDIFLIKIVII